MKNALAVVSTLVLVLVFAVFVWPTPWRYDHVGRDFVRQSRFGHEVQVLTRTGWAQIGFDAAPQSGPLPPCPASLTADNVYRIGVCR